MQELPRRRQEALAYYANLIGSLTVPGDQIYTILLESSLGQEII